VDSLKNEFSLSYWTSAVGSEDRSTLKSTLHGHKK